MGSKTKGLQLQEKSDIDAVNYNFDTMMYLSNIREEHLDFTGYGNYRQEQ